MTRFLRPLLALGLSFAATVAAAQATYRFSPVNQWDIAKTADYWNPIVQYVSRKSGVPMEGCRFMSCTCSSGRLRWISLRMVSTRQMNMPLFQ